MHDIMMRLKSGREFRFKCEEYTIKTFKPTGTLSEFSYKGGVGECPIYFQELDIECIAIIEKEKIEELEQVPSEDYISRTDTLEILDAMANVDKDNAKVYSKIYSQIKDAPSVVPKRGEWIDVSERGSWSIKNACDQCGEIVFQPNYNYCPNCGADMRGDTE